MYELCVVNVACVYVLRSIYDQMIYHTICNIFKRGGAIEHDNGTAARNWECPCQIEMNVYPIMRPLYNFVRK